jgi:hypothetical protein
MAEAPEECGINIAGLRVTAIEEITQELDAAVAAEMPKIPEV